MKNMKKALALLLAAVMLLAMSAVAMAVNNGTITVTGVQDAEGITATAYKIISWNLDENGDPTDPANRWADMSIETWLTEKGYPSDVSAYDTMDANQKNKIFNHMYQELGTGLTLPGIPGTVNSGVATFSDLEIGTYLIQIDGGNMNYSAVVANVEYNFSTENNKWEVKDGKAEAKSSSVPDIDKKVNKDQETEDGHNPDKSDTVQIGEIVDFDIVAKVPSYPKDAIYTKFEISDIMCKGLTYDATSLKVYGVNGDDKTLLSSPEAFNDINDGTKLFDLDFVYDQIKDYKEIHITYQAKVNEDIVLGSTGNTNEVKLTYQNNPFINGDYDTKEDEVRVFTFALNVFKYGNSNEETKLSGAEFKLIKKGDATQTGLQFVKEADGTYRFAVDADETTTDKLVTDADGMIKIKGLKDGEYQLIETKAPAGYNKATAPIDVELVQDKGSVEGTPDLTTGDATAKYQQTTKVNNNQGAIIPSTGGMGTTVFMVAGIVIMACAVVTLMMLLKRQKSSNEG